MNVLFMQIAMLVCSGAPETELRTPAKESQAPQTMAAVRRIVEAAQEANRGKPFGMLPKRVPSLGLAEVCFAEKEDGKVIRADANTPGPLRYTYVVLLNEKRRPVGLIEMPESESGDWMLEDFYLFDAAGRTVARRHFYSTYTDCEDGELHARSWVSIFSADGRVLLREDHHEESEKPLPPGCVLRDSVRDAPRSVAEALTARRLPRTF